MTIPRSDTAGMVREFRETFGLPISEKPELPNHVAMRLHHKLIAEEVAELYDALQQRDPAEVLDALGDIVYLCYGAAIDAGYDLDAALVEIHRSNMSKVDPLHGVLRRIDGKVLKGSEYSPPDLSSLFEQQ